MQVYLTMPGQVLASAPLRVLLSEQAQYNSDGFGTSTTAAASVSKSKKGRGRKQQLFYKSIDLLVLRRYTERTEYIDYVVGEHAVSVTPYCLSTYPYIPW